MDLRHHLGVLWRWRAVVTGGLLASLLISILVTFTPGGSHLLKWRSEATYNSTSRVYVTQPGFPLGRATLPGADPNAPLQKNSDVQSFAQPARFIDLAVIYSFLAQSNEVRALIRPSPPEKEIVVTVLRNPATGDPIPLLEIATHGNTAVGATRLNDAVVRALRSYLQSNASANNVPTKDRVSLQVLNVATPGVVIAGRSPTRTVVVLLLGIVGTLVATYMLENLFPRRRPGDIDADALDRAVAVELKARELASVDEPVSRIG
jgi:hypothetical protein